jgi:hypothetical protein
MTPTRLCQLPYSNTAFQENEVSENPHVKLQSKKPVQVSSSYASGVLQHCPLILTQVVHILTTALQRANYSTAISVKCTSASRRAVEKRAFDLTYAMNFRIPYLYGNQDSVYFASLLYKDNINTHLKETGQNCGVDSGGSG